MIGFIVRRIVGTIPILFFISVGIFLMIRLTPGDPVRLMLGEDADPQSVAALRAQLGLNDPLPVQYLHWIAGALHGQLGYSIRSHQPVVEAISSRLPVTLELSVFALIAALAIGLPAGILSALRPNSAIDVTAAVFALLGVSLPTFFLGIVLILIFALWLHALPPAGYVPLAESPVQNLRLMILPSITLGAALAGLIARMTRSSMLEALGADFIRTARAKGLSEGAIVLGHALKNAVVPVVTVLGLEVGALLGGAIVTETIFTLPGVGRLIVDSIFARDFPVVQGTVLFLALVRVASNLAADIVYGWVDPRISYS